MKNPYRKDLDIFFNRIIELKGTLFHVADILKKDLKKKKKVNSEFKEKIKSAVVSHLIISDISGPTDNGWEINFPTDVTREVLWEKYKNEIEKLISREACFLIAQSSEAFLRYFKNTVGTYLFLNKDYANKIDPQFSDCNTIDEYKSWVRRSGKINSTSWLFKILEEGCPKFQKVSTDNNLNVKFSDFYQALSFFRHKVTHSSSTFTKEEIEDKNWSKEIKAIFDYYFPYETKSEDIFIFKLDKLKGQNNLKRIAEIAFQMYKALSICSELEWKFERQEEAYG